MSNPVVAAIDDLRQAIARGESPSVVVEIPLSEMDDDDRDAVIQFFMEED